ncbi:hypothetical protein PCORN_01695 [Listeria cornellensis FSL F6-0969]|uniref:Uncharacterized protein n=1 Tax=Listeria cornellensis FSL F6-0969 TaxID=1265820 RepID=W7CA69_9LIST|nr:hypothetical protein PCORN_01695 [Listeria cornellensis FSL F6-0969]
MLERGLGAMIIIVCYRMIVWIETNVSGVKDSRVGSRRPTPNLIRILVLVVFLLILYIMLKVQVE